MTNEEIVFDVLLLVAGLYFTACGDDSDVPANGYIETTEEGSATFVLKGYEDASDGFNVFEGEGFENLSISWRRSLREVHGTL